MARRLLTAWESLPPRRQIAFGAPAVFALLLVVHLVGFPNLTLTRSIAYALMESLPIALIITYATQVELVRREIDAEETPSSDGARGDRDQLIGIDGDIVAPPPPPPNSGAGHADV
ncbi:MAG: hypothetical protein JWN41_109 [Thermoleophilia bacterium]|nr:hypothetical protein [Thermoleophilia bacterium]